MMIFSSPRSIAVCLVTVLWSCGISATACATEQPPNIIFILADDLGYGDLGCYGQTKIKTPHIDRLAKAGIRFTNFYAGSTVCAPSRCVLMTGLHLGHCRVRGNTPVAKMQTLSAEDFTVAELLKQGGYATAVVGKWGLGEEGSTGIPNRQGFDLFFGYLNQVAAHNFYPASLWRNQQKILLRNEVTRYRVGNWGVGGIATKKAEYSPQLMLDEALAFIDRNQDRPFFLYFAHTIPHANNEAARELGDGSEVPNYGIYENKPWKDPEKGAAAMITYLDSQVGRLVQHLGRLGIDENTLIFFASDNGPELLRWTGWDPKFFGSAGPLRGWKRDLYEGGIRVPLIAHWPGKIQSGVTSDHVGYFGDMMATVAELAGIEPPAKLDSISLVPTLMGSPEKQARHDYLYWEFYQHGSSQAVRMGRWKGVIKPLGGERIELYDLESDLGEQHNVVDGHPEIVARIRTAAREAHVASPLWKVRRQQPKQTPTPKPNQRQEPAGFAAANPFGRASWLRDPVFQGMKIGTPRPFKGRAKVGSSPTENTHTYLRNEIELLAKPVKAVLHITGDDYYKFYVNGQFVVQGPEPGYPFAHPYYTLDVTRFLKKGQNCLAAHAFYFGLFCRERTSGDNRSGFMLALELTFPDGSTGRYTTDQTWKCHTAKSFPSSHMFGYATQFNENIDMRVEPIGWRELEFDDSGWGTPLAGRQDHVFVKQITPPLDHWRADPVVFKQKSAGRYFLDFGREIVGHTRIRLEGPRDHVITVWHGEELAAKDTVRHQMRCNCDYVDKITLSGGDDLIEFFDYRGFRYVEILDAPSKPEVWVDVRHHPFDASASHFDSSDELLNRIWTLCKNSVQMGCQGVVVDCPTREKGQWLADTHWTLLSQLILTADPTLAKKAMTDFRLSQRFDPGILGVAPGSTRFQLAEYSLMWPMILANYYWMTGDDATLRELVDAGLEKLLDYYREMEGPSGLLTGVGKKRWVLVDWPPSVRGGYDYELTKNREHTVVNAYYYKALRTAAELMRHLGRDDSPYDVRADRLQRAFLDELLDPATGLFVDGRGSQHSSLHANAVPLNFGLVPERNVQQVIELIRRKRLDCGLFTAANVIEGCYQAGEPDLAYSLITSTDKHSWHSMLEAGATTTMEAWTVDLKKNISWCHPVGSTPIYLIVTRLMGLTPGEPGWKVVRVAPEIPQGLDSIELKFPCPTGSITAKYERQQGYRITLPTNTRTVVDVPKTLKVVVQYAQ